MFDRMELKLMVWIIFVFCFLCALVVGVVYSIDSTTVQHRPVVCMEDSDDIRCTNWYRYGRDAGEQ